MSAACAQPVACDMSSFRVRLRRILWRFVHRVPVPAARALARGWSRRVGDGCARAGVSPRVEPARERVLASVRRGGRGLRSRAHFRARRPALTRRQGNASLARGNCGPTASMRSSTSGALRRHCATTRRRLLRTALRTVRDGVRDAQLRTAPTSSAPRGVSLCRPRRATSAHRVRVVMRSLPGASDATCADTSCARLRIDVGRALRSADHHLARAVSGVTATFRAHCCASLARGVPGAARDHCADLAAHSSASPTTTHCAPLWIDMCVTLRSVGDDDRVPVRCALTTSACASMHLTLSTRIRDTCALSSLRCEWRDRPLCAFLAVTVCRSGARCSPRSAPAAPTRSEGRFRVRCVICFWTR